MTSRGRRTSHKLIRILVPCETGVTYKHGTAEAVGLIGPQGKFVMPHEFGRHTAVVAGPFLSAGVAHRRPVRVA
jgi:hypothetical protein